LSFVFKDLILPVYVEEQQTEDWCWAAADLAVLEYYNPTHYWTQSEVVKAANDSESGFLAKNTKNLRQTNTRCDPAPNWWKSLIDAVNNNKPEFTKKFLCAPDFVTEITFDMLRAELIKGKPVCVSVVWWDSTNKTTQQVGHAMVLTGITDDGYLLINDPWYGIIYIGTEDFANGKYCGNGYWSNTDFTVFG
jgi:Peptidase_C39 like family